MWSGLDYCRLNNFSIFLYANLENKFCNKQSTFCIPTSSWMRAKGERLTDRQRDLETKTQRDKFDS